MWRVSVISCCVPSRPQCPHPGPIDARLSWNGAPIVRSSECWRISSNGRGFLPELALSNRRSPRLFGDRVPAAGVAPRCNRKCRLRSAHIGGQFRNASWLTRSSYPLFMTGSDTHCIVIGRVAQRRGQARTMPLCDRRPRKFVLDCLAAMADHSRHQEISR